MWLLNFTSIMFVLSLCATLGVAKQVIPPIEVEALNCPDKMHNLFSVFIPVPYGGRVPNRHGIKVLKGHPEKQENVQTHLSEQEWKKILL